MLDAGRGLVGDEAVDAAGLVVDGAEEVGRFADVLGGEAHEGVVGVAHAFGGDALDGAVVVG